MKTSETKFYLCPATEAERKTLLRAKSDFLKKLVRLRLSAFRDKQSENNFRAKKHFLRNLLQFYFRQFCNKSDKAARIGQFHRAK